MFDSGLPYDYLVVEGNIGAGKTTLTRKLAEDFGGRTLYEQFDDNPFLPLFYADRERYALMVELYFMTERHGQLSDSTHGRTLFGEPLFADFLFLKTWLFARTNLKEPERTLFKRIFDSLNERLPTPDLLVYLHRPVDVLLGNIAGRGRGYESGITAEYLLRIERTYWDYLRSEERFPILLLEMGERDFEVVEADYAAVVREVLAKAETGLRIVDLR